MQWEIYALYEFLSRKVRSPNELSKAVTSASGVNQRCPLSSTHFGLNTDELSHYIERIGGSGACLTGIAMQILLYVDDIVLISDSLEEPQRHLNAGKVFCTDKGLLINMDKTKVMVFFNTTQGWVTRSESELFSGEEKVAYTCSHR